MRHTVTSKDITKLLSYYYVWEVTMHLLNTQLIIYTFKKPMATAGGSWRSHRFTVSKWLVVGGIVLSGLFGCGLGYLFICMDAKWAGDGMDPNYTKYGI